MSQDIEEIDEKTCKEASEFIHLFYETIDRKREKLVHLYCNDNATLVWNGNPVEGQENIFKFISSLPETDHTAFSIDAHRIPQEVADIEDPIVSLVAGTVMVGGKEHAYTQSFTLVREDGKVKIRADRFRYVD